MKKILVVYNHDSSFVRKDMELLSKHYEITPFNAKLNKSNLKQLVLDNDIIFSWFASAHAYYPFYYAKKFGKKTVVAVGGYDASDIKGYGMFDGMVKRWIVTHVYRRADVILPVDSSLSDVILTYLPEVKSKIRVVPTGYDSNVYKHDGRIKQKQVIMVCEITKTNWWRKGIKTYIDVANLMPDTPFYLVGDIVHDKFDGIRLDQYMKHENLTITGYIDTLELINLYQDSKVFALLSKHEGLPNALCEAMLCGCIPVTTGVNGVPHAQGDTGFSVPYCNAEASKKAINEALGMNNGYKARERIKTLFPLEKREWALMEVMG